MKIVIAEPLTKSLSALVDQHQPEWVQFKNGPKDKNELIKRLEGAVAASSYSIKYDKEIFQAVPSLKFLAIPAVGANFFVDMDDAKEYGVTVMNCPGYNSEAVAEMALLSALAVARMTPLLQRDLRKGVWDESSRGNSLLVSGKNIGLIGRGNVAKAIEKLLQGWSVNVESVNSRSTAKEVDELIADSDVLFICVPATEMTKGMISATRIRSMKKSSILVNVGRGAVIDEDALYEALSSNQIHGAGLDVFIDEPEYGSSVPETVQRFVELDNVFATPHLAGSSRESSEVLGRMIYENLEGAQNGAPMNIYTE